MPLRNASKPDRAPSDSRDFSPTAGHQRVDNLDLLRGFATLGTFYVSAIAYALPHAAFFNLKSPETNNWLDWCAAVFGELLFDQKAVALLALLYGAGVVRLAERAVTSGAGVRRHVWRRAVGLFVLGVPVGMHGLLWEGTTLWFFGLFTPMLLLLRNRSNRVLIGLGVLGIVFATLEAFDFQPRTTADLESLGQYWTTGEHGAGELAVGYVFLSTVFVLASAMTIGLVVGRVGLLDADPHGTAVRRMIRYGFGVGIPLTVATLVWRMVGDFEPDVAISAEAPNTLATIPMTLGFVGLITRWGASGPFIRLGERVRAVGRMALTNSIVQTIFGIFLLRDYGFGRGTLSRGELVLVVFAVWATQLAASKPLLDRFGYGPFEWLVRSVTYKRRIPFRSTPRS